MSRRLVVLSCSLLLAGSGLACQSAGNESAIDDRLAAIEDRLSAIESTVDADSKSLSTVAAWVAEQQTEKKQREAERAERRKELDARRQEREERMERRRQLREDSDFPSRVDPLGDPEPSDREIEGAAEGVQCLEGEPTIQCTIDRAFIEHLIANPALLTKQARVVPSQKDGVIQGYKLYGIRRGSLPKLLGLKNGDMITAVNGSELTSIDEAMNLYTELRRASHLDIEVERKGKPVELLIDIIE